MIGVVRVGGASNPGPRQARGPGMGEVTLSKRGTRAWENYHSQPLLPLAEGGTTRPLVHAIGDATAVQWLPRVRGFLISCKRQGMKLECPGSVDAAIAQHLDWMCYSQRLLPSHGSLLMFGMLCIMLELSGHLCLTSRSLKSWQKLAVTVEGDPMAEEAVFMVAHFFFKSGAYYEGAWTLLQYDVYAREQDMESLRENDIDFDGRVVSLHFGVSTRGGESVKTSTNQGGYHSPRSSGGHHPRAQGEHPEGRPHLLDQPGRLPEGVAHSLRLSGDLLRGRSTRASAQLPFGGHRPRTNLIGGREAPRTLESLDLGAEVHQDFRAHQISLSHAAEAIAAWPRGCPRSSLCAAQFPEVLSQWHVDLEQRLHRRVNRRTRSRRPSR